MIDITKLTAVIRATAATIAPGVPATIEAGRAVFELVKSVAPTLTENDQRALQAALPDLLTKMNAHVDQAVGDLRG